MAVSGRVRAGAERVVTLRVGRPDLPRRIDRRSGLSRAMDRPALAGPAVGRRARTDHALSSGLWEDRARHSRLFRAAAVLYRLRKRVSARQG